MDDLAAKDYPEDIGLVVSECTENVKLGVKRPALLQNMNNVGVCGDYLLSSLSSGVCSVVPAKHMPSNDNVPH